MDIRLDGRVVLLSGAAQGIGRAMAHAFRGAGARIHLTDLDSVGLAAAGDSLSAPVHVCDLSDRESAHRLVADRRLTPWIGWIGDWTQAAAAFDAMARRAFRGKAY